MKSRIGGQRFIERHTTSRGETPDCTGITLRAVAVGCLMCAIIAVGAPYGRQVIKGTSMALTSTTPVAFFLLFVLLLSIHILLALCRRRWAFRRTELITIFFMMMVASAIPTKGVTSLLLPMISGVAYYATPENEWGALIQPFLPHWLLVEEPLAVRQFYEGSSRPDIPWGAWLSPLLYWLLFYAGFYLTLTCVMVVVRRQWVEHERLPYPLAQAALAMLEEGDGGGLVRPFFKKWTMWAGFALPFVVSTVNALHHYFPSVTPIALSSSMGLFQQHLTLRFGLNFLMLGFAYFISTSISFSIWFFYLVHLVQESLFYNLGIPRAEAELGWLSDPGMGHQMMGALIVLAVAGLWIGRRHFSAVWRRAVLGVGPADDAGEIMSYRSAFAGLLVGTLTMWIWLWQSGIPAWIAPLFIFAGLVIFIGLTRIIVEAGLPTVVPAMIPAGFVVSAVGVPALGVRGMIAAGYTMVWCGDILVFMMAPLANGLRLSSEISGNRRPLLWAIGAAMLISLVSSIWFTLYLAYRHGSLNLTLSYATEPTQFAARKLLNPTGPSLSGWLWTGGGALFMTLLIAARQRFIWWPFHPLGFVASMGWVMNYMWSTVFLAWLFKVLILKYGGARMYRKAQPLFLGMILGQLVVGGLWLVIDGFTGMMGNRMQLYK